jgi:acetolactate synthase-1/2/3 large subunit
MGYCADVNDKRTVAAEILEILWASGVRIAYGIPGVHNLAFWNALNSERPRIIGVRHEQSAVYAADGNFRTSGTLGVAITTTGPGAANTLGAFGEAAISNSSVLVISSEAPIGLRKSGISRGLLHEMQNQNQLFAPLAKQVNGKPLALSVVDPQSAIEGAKFLIKELVKAPRGVGYLGIPSDVLSSIAPNLVDPTPDNSINDLELTKLKEVIESAEKISIWAGGGAVDCAEEITKAAEHLGAPIFTSFAGRGVGGQSKNYLSAPIHEPEIAELLKESDTLLVFGSELDGMNTKNWSLTFPNKVVIIDPAPEKPAANSNAVLAITTSAFTEVASQILTLKTRSAWADYQEICTGVRNRLLKSEKEQLGISLVSTIEQSWRIENSIICDMAVSGYWVGVYGHNSRPRRIAYPVGWGTLGFALPAAIGAAANGPTLVVCGDGGIAFALGELATIRQEKLPITILLNDDGGYGMLRFDQQVMNHPERGVDLFNPNWKELASSFGINFQEVNLNSLSKCLVEAQKSNAPNLILYREKLYPPRSTSPRWREN